MELEALDVPASISRRASRTESALMRIDRGEGHHHVAVRAAASTTSSFGMPLAGLGLHVDREHYQADLSLAVIGDRLGDGRALARLEVFVGRVLEWLPEGSAG